MDWSESGFIISFWKDILATQQTFKVYYVKRQANKVVDALTKAACSYASPSYWFTPPNLIAGLIEDDVNSVLINND